MKDTVKKLREEKDNLELHCKLLIETLRYYACKYHIKGDVEDYVPMMHRGQDPTFLEPNNYDVYINVEDGSRAKQAIMEFFKNYKGNL